MTKPQVKEYNCETGEEIIRDANAEEIAQMKIDAQRLASQKADLEAKAQTKAELLDRLGITEDEAKLLLG